jgi:hypothetical protein
MITPVVLSIDANREYTKQDSTAAYKRLREHLIQYGVLLKNKHYDPIALLQQLRKNSDPSIDVLIRNIIDEMPITAHTDDWDGKFDTIKMSHSLPVLACVSTDNHPENPDVEFVNWYDVDSSHTIDVFKQQRKVTRLPKGQQQTAIWRTFFEPIYTLVPINRIEIIDRYLLTNIINHSTKQLNNYLCLLAKSHTSTSKKKSLIIYSSCNQLDLDKIKSHFYDELLPLCKRLSCISKVCVFVCRDNDFTTHYHDRYIISSTKDKTFYVHKLGIGLELFAHDELHRSQECSLTVHTLATVMQYRDMLNQLENNRYAKHDEHIT